jgi:hypothetical protein
MRSLSKRWPLGLARRIRWLRRDANPWPATPAGVFLNPSDADFASYDEVRLALTWARAAIADPAVWQKTVRVKLRQLLGIPQSPKPAATLGGARETTASGLCRQTIYLPSVKRRHVPVTVVWDAAQSSRLPVMLCLQGHTSGAHISWAEARSPADEMRIENGGDYACQAVAHGHVAICIEQIAFGERREQALIHRWDHACVDACNRALLLGRTVLGDRVADVFAVLDWLQSSEPGLPSMDIGTVRAMGNSAGAETALFATALDPRIEAVIASGCVGAWRKTSGTRKTCPDTVIPGVLAWIEYSDILALCAPRPLLVVSGVNDHIYPFHLAAECTADAEPVYAAMRAAHRLRAVSGSAGHRFYPDVAWPAFLDLLVQATP